MLKWPGLHYSTSAFAPKHYPQGDRRLREHARRRQDHLRRLLPDGPLARAHHRARCPTSASRTRSGRSSSARTRRARAEALDAARLAVMLDHVSIQCADVRRQRRASTTPCSRRSAATRDHGLRRRHRVRRAADARLLDRAAADRRGLPRVAHRVRTRPTGRPSGRSSTPPWRPAPRCCTSRGCGPSTTRTTTARSCATPTATTSRPSATRRSSPAARSGRASTTMGARRPRRRP